MSIYRYGCIGAGSIAINKHLKGYDALDNVSLVAICDVSDQALINVKEKYPDIHTYENHKEMFENENLDIVSVCTPNKFHKQYTIDALEAGINVHCEKPIAMNEKEAIEMVNAKNRTGKKLMLGLNNRFTNEASFIRQYVKDGNLGNIYYVRCGWRRRRFIPKIGGWFTKKELSGGGPLIDLGVHFIDLTLHFMDYPSPISVSASTYKKFANSHCKNLNISKGIGEYDYDIEDLATGFIRLDNDATISFEFSFAMNNEKEEYFYELFGDKGGVSFINGQLKIFTEINDTIVDVIPNTKYPNDDLNEFAHFIDVIEGKVPCLSMAEDGIKMMRIIDATYESATKKKEVTF
ncbi:MAG: Gfo/Idh/MocA family oxidoreductase [Clostridiales bacterium]|nr:Gfo/Idh/MocA family oxidoreductase [Clostridiales bacterium]